MPQPSDQAHPLGLPTREASACQSPLPQRTIVSSPATTETRTRSVARPGNGRADEGDDRPQRSAQPRTPRAASCLEGVKRRTGVRPTSYSEHTHAPSQRRLLVVPKLNPLDANVSTALAAIAVTLSLVFASAAQPA